MDITIRMDDLKSVWRSTKKSEKKLNKYGPVSKRMIKKFKDRVKSTFFPLIQEDFETLWTLSFDGIRMSLDSEDNLKKYLDAVKKSDFTSYVDILHGTQWSNRVDVRDLVFTM